MIYLILRFFCFNEKFLNIGVFCVFNNLLVFNIFIVLIFCIDKKIILKFIVIFNLGVLLGKRLKRLLFG